MAAYAPYIIDNGGLRPDWPASLVATLPGEAAPWAFHSLEHFVLTSLAVVMKCPDTADALLGAQATLNDPQGRGLPRRFRRLAREVSGYCPDAWDRALPGIMATGVAARLQGCGDARRQLSATGDRPLIVIHREGCSGLCPSRKGGLHPLADPTAWCCDQRLARTLEAARAALQT